MHHFTKSEWPPGVGLDLARFALDATTCGIVITGCEPDHPIIYVNKAFLAISEYSEQEILGRNCRFLQDGLSEFESRLNEEPLRRIRSAIENRHSCEATLRNRKKSGVRFWNTLRLSPILDGAGLCTHFIGVQDDVTRSVQERAASTAVRDRLNAVLTAAPDAILTLDAQDRVGTVNPAAERLFGWDAGELAGRRLEDLIPGVAGAAGVEIDAIFGDEASPPDAMTGARIVQARRKDGTSFPARVSLARYEHSGKATVVAVAHDISDVVSAQQALRRMSADLQDQLAAAEAANEAKKQFLAVTNHEIRTPLHGIIGMAQLLRMTPMTETQEKYLTIIDECGATLLKIVHDILDVTRIDAGSLRIDRSRVDLPFLLKKAINSVSAEALRKEIEIVADLDASLHEVALWSDALRVKQIVSNLLTNALKFSDRGPIVVRARADLDRSVIRVEVADRGIGVPVEKRELIFERFSQGDQGMSRKYGGIGLGLSICRDIVGALGGEIGLERTDAPGSTFWFTLPVRAEDHDRA